MNELFRDRDFLSGLLFLGVATLLLTGALELHMGRALAMGPGYFPILLASILGILAIITITKAIFWRSEPIEALRLWPAILVSAAVLLFGLLIRTAGLSAATIAAVTLASCASREIRWYEVAFLALGLAAFNAVVFIYFLKIPVGL